jgi:uncharacterized protein YndB with AHSA1/START domain
MLASHSPQDLKIHFEIEIAAPPDKVWAKLATPEGMSEWFARDLVFEHKIGGRFEMKGEMPGEGPYRFTGRVTKIEPERELAFTWKDELTSPGWPVETLVSFRLEPTATGTRVTLTHTGFQQLGAGGKEAYEGHVQGWSLSETLTGLKDAVEKAA